MRNALRACISTLAVGLVLAPSLAAADYRRFRQLYPDPYAAPYFQSPPAYRYTPPPPAYYGPPLAYPYPSRRGSAAYEGPFAYGWVPTPPRPSSCGKYYYWDGAHCVDARRWPPYVGRKW